MTAYLITFKPSTENPKRGWPEEDLLSLAKQVRDKGHAREPWRFDRKHGVTAGDRVFLLRQGRRGPAILGYGRVVTPAANRPDGMADVEFDALVDPTTKLVYATREELHALPTKAWNTQSSGITLPDQIGASLESLVVGRTPVEMEDETASNPDWTRDELIVALDFYLKHRPNPPGKESDAIRSLSETIQALGEKLFTPFQRSRTFRNANGVYMKLMNFRRLDPTYTVEGKTGLLRGARGEEEVWQEFANDPERCKQVAKAIIASVNDPEIGPPANEDQDDGIDEAPEGKLLTRKHTARERNRKLVDKKKKQALRRYGKLVCEGCGFDFAARYGGRGNGFIECHHTLPVSELAEGQKTNIRDLALVCANCHRVIHRLRPWLTLPQLKGLLS